MLPASSICVSNVRLVERDRTVQQVAHNAVTVAEGQADRAEASDTGLDRDQSKGHRVSVGRAYSRDGHGTGYRVELGRLNVRRVEVLTIAPVRGVNTVSLIGFPISSLACLFAFVVVHLDRQS